MLFVVPVVLFDMLKAKQLACVSESGQKCPAARSLSLRRAWIEIICVDTETTGLVGRSPYGERGLKCSTAATRPVVWSRSPYGERGLKSLAGRERFHTCPSLSLRRAWIEIWRLNTLSTDAWSLSLRRAWIEICSRASKGSKRLSLSLRRAWIEIATTVKAISAHESLSLRRAWIEINGQNGDVTTGNVALLTESVD